MGGILEEWSKLRGIAQLVQGTQTENIPGEIETLGQAIQRGQEFHCED